VKATPAKILLAAAVVTALVPLWGYWYAIRHASLQLRVDDYALRSPTQSYGIPHGVSLVLRDASNAQLAVARSVEPLGYLLAVHPDPRIGNCEHLTQASQGDYAACYEKYSAWSATWADRVRRADVTVGSCEARAVPVTVRRSNSEWPVWWVPLRHLGGLPRQYFEFVIALDSRACAAVAQDVSQGR
jgi:hypothetical protein